MKPLTVAPAWEANWRKHLLPYKLHLLTLLDYSSAAIGAFSPPEVPSSGVAIFLVEVSGTDRVHLGS